LTTPRHRLSLRWWLLLSYLTVLVLPFAALVGSGALGEDLRRQTRTNLAAQGETWALTLAREHEAASTPLAQAVADHGPMLADARERTLTAIRIVDVDGTIVASSGADVGRRVMDHREVASALRGERADAVRPRAPLRPGDADMLGPSRFADVQIFVATPVVSRGRVVGAVVVSRTPRAEVQALLQMGPRLQLGLAIALAVTVALALGSMHFGSRSLSRLARAARRIAAGARTAPELARLSASRVHEVALTARAVEVMRAHMQARVDDAEDLADNVAHEFRTPIATLRGTFELLHDDPEMPSPQRRRFVANAIEELDRLVRLVSGLLALARAERRHENLRIDLDALLQRVASRHEEVRLDGRAGHVRGSPGQLELVFDNLLRNARQHAGRDAAITIQASSTADEITLAVIDDGPGISPSNLARVFDRFFTTDRARGLGLGLPLARLVCRTHGGDLHARSAPGRTEFTIRLPVIDGPCAGVS
jgi:signal transduction histidine kinase